MEIYKTKWFARFANKEKISDDALCEAVKRAEEGNIDADHHGGVISQRIAREGQGTRKGYRTVILFRQGDRAFFVHGYERKNQNRIEKDELMWYRELARSMLNQEEAILQKKMKIGEIIKVESND